MDKISIIVPVYNMEKYLADCLESILNQTYKNLEIIIVNDGSTDTSEDIIIRYSRKYSNIISTYQSNQGLSMARNTGLKLATGDYVTFVDSDDIIDKHMIEILMKVLKKDNADIVYTSFQRFERNSDLKRLVKQDSGIRFKKKVCNSKEAIRYYFMQKSGNVCGGLFRLKLFEDITFPPNLIFEDNLPKSQLLHKSKCTVFIDAGYYYYRNTQNSITNKKFNEKKYDFLKIGYMIENYLKSNDASNFNYYKRYYYKLFIDSTYDILKESLLAQSYNYRKIQANVPLHYILKLLFLGILLNPRRNGAVFQQVFLKILYTYSTSDI